MCVSTIFIIMFRFPKNALYSSQSAKDGNWRIISIGEDSLGFGTKNFTIFLEKSL